MRSNIVDLVVTDLAAVGIELDVQIVESVELAGVLGSAAWDLAILPFDAPPGLAEASRSLIDLLAPDGFENIYTYGGSISAVAAERSVFQLRVFSSQMGVSSDRDRVLDLLGEAHRLLAAEVVFVPLVSRPQYTIVREGRLDGVVANATSSRLTWNIEQWRYTDD